MRIDIRCIRCTLRSPSGPMQLYILCLLVLRSSFPASNVDITDTVALPAEAGNFTSGETQVKRHHTQFTCVTCSLPVKTGKFTCFYAASTSHRIHAIARYKALKAQLISPAGCRLTHLQFAGEFTRGMIADSLQLQVFLGAIAGIFICDCAGLFACVWRVFLPATLVFYLRISCIFACKSKQFCMLVVGKFVRVPHVNLLVKYPIYSGKFTCDCRHFAYILREVLAT